MRGITEQRRSQDRKASISKKHHVLLFRHCVRSTDTQVNVYDSANSSSVPLRNFWPTLVQPEVRTPNWNVPTNWCTERTVQQMQDTGTYVYNTFLRSASDDDRRPLKFHFISDTAQRDADTALALQKGLSLAYFADPSNMNDSLSSSNLHVTEYVPSLFSPFAATSVSTSPICSLQVTPNQWLEEAQTRLSSIAPPPFSMVFTLTLLQLINENDPQEDSINATSTLVFDVSIGPRLSGIINVVKLAVQTLFYSRAAGVTPLNFLQRITNEQIYQQLLPWVHYSRSILNVGTSEAASRGAVLIRAIVDALEIPNETIGTTEDHVTFLVGHDTDIDAVATALDVTWAFDAPYYTSDARSDWYATPPGSAIYITHDAAENGGTVSLSYLYPIFNLNDGTIQSWELVPLQLRNVDDGSSRMNEHTSSVTWAQFQEQLQTTLRRYTGATECYNRAADLSASIFRTDVSQTTVNTDSGSWKSFGGGFGAGVAASILLAFLAWMYHVRRLRRLRSLYSAANSVHLNEDDDLVHGSIQKVVLS